MNQKPLQKIEKIILDSWYGGTPKYQKLIKVNFDNIPKFKLNHKKEVQRTANHFEPIYPINLQEALDILENHSKMIYTSYFSCQAPNEKLNGQANSAISIKYKTDEGKKYVMAIPGLNFKSTI